MARWRAVVGAASYALLKLVVLIVLFVFPGLALWLAYDHTRNAHIDGWLKLVLSLIGIAAASSFVVVAVADTKYVWNVARRLAGNR